MLLNDAVTEKVARAIHEIGYGPLEACRAAARACLEATLPDMVERCAKEVEDTPSRQWNSQLLSEYFEREARIGRSNPRPLE